MSEEFRGHIKIISPKQRNVCQPTKCLLFLKSFGDISKYSALNIEICVSTQFVVGVSRLSGTFLIIISPVHRNICQHTNSLQCFDTFCAISTIICVPLSNLIRPIHINLCQHTNHQMTLSPLSRHLPLSYVSSFPLFSLSQSMHDSP